MTDKKRRPQTPWQHIKKQLHILRSRRRTLLWNDAQLPQRRRFQQMTRTFITPIIVVASVATIYLGMQATVIQVNQLRTPAPNSLPATLLEDQNASPSFVAGTKIGTPMLQSNDSVRSQPITHIAIPIIKLDSPVVEVNWDRTTDTNGQSILVWQVAQYAVGHHFTSANPGQPNNIVLSGHVAGYGKVFRNLDQLHPNDQIILTSGTHQFTYIVQQQILVDEQHASPSEQIANLSYIDNTPSEMLTLITCWPPIGVNRFSQRLIIRALPQPGKH